MSFSIEEYGFNADVAEAFGKYPEATPARVIEQHRGLVHLITPHGVIKAQPKRGVHPTVGDWVEIRRSGDVWHVADVIVRDKYISRASDRGEQVLASNVDVVFVCMSLDLDRTVPRLTRYVALATDSGAETVVVLTKLDKAPDVEVGAKDAVESAFRVESVATSVTSGAGIEEVRQRIGAGRTAVVIGPSGAGKSALVNALCRTEVRETGEVRETDGRGRHTTSFRGLVLLPEGGCLIDTPGLREIQLAIRSDATDDFADLEDVAAGCGFRNCTHTTEPVCAIRDGIESGDLDPNRVGQWKLTSSDSSKPAPPPLSRAEKKKLSARREFRSGADDYE